MTIDGIATGAKIIDVLAMMLMVTSIMIVGNTRIHTCVWAYVLNSIALAVIAGSVAYFTGIKHIYVAAGLAVLIKCIAIPYMFFYIINKIQVKREIELYVSIPSSLMIAGGLVILAYYVTQPIAGLGRILTSHCLPVSIATALIGLFIMVSRKKALTQVLGLLIMENGIFLATIAITYGMPMIVEFGLFFDILVGVLIMGILTYRISRTFDSIDVSKLTSLRG